MMDDSQSTRCNPKDPGLPSTHPTLSFWARPPAPIAHHRSASTSHADVVIIGSGITGASVARELLRSNVNNQLVLVMLEAREACGGASSRNGGHIGPASYHDYDELVKEYGVHMAQEVIRFRLSSCREIEAAAEEEGLSDHSQFRRVESCDVYLSEQSWKAAKSKLAIFQRDMPREAKELHPFGSPKWCFYEREEAIQKYGLSNSVVGCIPSTGHALHPYRFVTGILANLLNRYASRFHLLTDTPCTSISAPSSSLGHYTVFTPAGEIRASHVIHCTNGHTSHLLVPLRNHIVPVRGTMSAQIPPRALQRRGSLQKGRRLFTFAGDGYHYLAQLPTATGELMLGGGPVYDGREPCVVDDGACNPDTVSDLDQAIPTFFGDEGGDDTEKGRMDAVWSGIFALSSDGLPWVGRLSEKLSGRKAFDGVASTSGLATPGEWLCGGYSGEGMVHAWLSGKALACMVLGLRVDWLPKVMLASDERWRREGFGTSPDQYYKFREVCKGPFSRL